MMINPGISEDVAKRVGWFPRQVSWPYNMRDIDAMDDAALLELYRFLPAPENDLQRMMISRIIERLFTERRTRYGI